MLGLGAAGGQGGGEREVGAGAAEEEAEPAAVALRGGVEGLGVEGDELVVGVEGSVAFGGDCCELRIARGGSGGECGDLLLEGGGFFGEMGASGEARI